MRKLLQRINIKIKNRNNKHKKKELKKNINFKLLLQNFLLGYFAYYSFLSALLVTFPSFLIPDNTILYFLPLPLYLFIVAIAVEMDNKRTLNNYHLQDEINFYKEMYKVRKKAEELYDY